jgi:hypothetical protein
VRTCTALVLGTATLAALTTLAVASTAHGPETAMPATQLAPLMQGAATSGRAASASARVARVVPLPRSLVGKQLAWLLAEFNDGSATLTGSELREHLGKHFLTVAPPHEVIRFLRHANEVDGSVDLVGFAGRPTTRSATAIVTTSTGRRYRVRLVVEGRSRLIDSLDIDAQPEA